MNSSRNYSFHSNIVIVDSFDYGAIIAPNQTKPNQTKRLLLVVFLFLSNLLFVSCTLQVKLTKAEKSKEKDKSAETIANDKTAPNVTAMAVNDGTYSGSTTQSSQITWNAGVDTESGIAKYEVAVGSSLGTTDTLAWTDVGNVTTIQLLGTFSSGVIYYASVRATDLAGNVSAVVSGDGWMTDSVSPLAPSSLDDGIMGFGSTTTPQLTWNAGSDVLSGLQGYQVAIGTTLGNTDTQNWTSVGNVISAALTGVNLFGSTKYYPSVRAQDNAGNVSSALQGDGWYNFSQSKLALDNSPTTPRGVSSSAGLGTTVVVIVDS